MFYISIIPLSKYFLQKINVSNLTDPLISFLKLELPKNC